MVNGLEAMADGIMRYEGWDPKTRSFVNRNPGNLRLGVHFGVDHLPIDDKGYTIFPDFCTGYSALLRELQSKFTGNNRHNIGPASTLLALMKVYSPAEDSNQPQAYADFLAKWLTQALNKPITAISELCNIWRNPLAGDAQPTPQGAAQ